MPVPHVPLRLEVSAYLADSRGRACPQPIIDLALALKRHPLVELWADDPAAYGDLLAFCEATGHTLVSVNRAPLQAVLRRKAPPAQSP